MNTYEKQTNGKYFSKYSKNGNLMREAEQHESGNWIIHCYGKCLDISGEYSDKQFIKMKKLYFN